jgi:5-formyltetrahydrofolate cyclo-ligase
MKSGSTNKPNPLSEVKRAVREHNRALREAQTPEKVREASAALCAQLAKWDVLQRAKRVMAYIAFRNELDLAPLFDLLPAVEWIVPRVVGKRLVLHPYDHARLVRHRYGMLEPSKELPVISPSALDVVLVPGVAFDCSGGRTGFGGGFYDGFLPTTRAIRVGITYDDCLVDEVPCDDHDQRMDWLATPTRIVRASDGPSDGDL